MAQYKTTTSLSIVAIPVIAQYGITSYIAQFKQAHPNIQFTLDEREATAILPLLNNHQFDLAFLRDNYLDREQYAFLEVARDKFQVILSRHHRLAVRESIALKELSDENFIMFDKGTIVHELAVDACRANGFEPRIFYASLRVESVLGLVASNSGVALMMEKVFSYHRHPDVIAIPLKESIASNLVLARLKKTKESRAARTFFNFMEKTLAD
jgi:LysR family transcriptional regulator, transcription activator of glutamate synthase operon